jgi:hypothetical protein
MRPPEKGTRAAYKYQDIKYYHFDVQPGTSLLLSANPWSYLSAWFSQKIKATNAPKRQRYEKGKYFAEQAESFFEASEHTKLPTKGTLVYYSMLNLVKALLSVRGVDLEVKVEHHGISVPMDTSNELNISAYPKGSISIFHEFCKALGYPTPHKQSIDIGDIYSQIPEIHEIAFTLGHLKNRKRSFLPVNIEFYVNDKKDKAFVEIRYEKKNEVRVPCDKFFKGKMQNYFKLISENENGCIVYRSKRRKSVTSSNWPRIYKNICNELKPLRFSSLLTRNGYRYYANLLPGPLPQLPSVFALMFFIGSIARYKPSLTKELMQGDLYPILAESIESSPKQFLYQITSEITDSVCAIPMAKL